MTHAAAQPLVTVHVSGMTTKATRVAEKRRAALLEQDWDAFAETMREDISLDDRRPGLRFTGTGADIALANAKAYASIGIRRSELELMAIRGDRLSLHRMRVDGGKDGSFDAETLYLVECDEDGRCSGIVWLAADDIDEAMSELDERYANGEGAWGAEVIRYMSRLLRALNKRPIAVDASTVDEDVVLVDRRSVSMGEIRGRGPVMEAWRTLRELAPDMRSDNLAYHALAPDRCVMEQLNHGMSEDDAWVEIGFYGIAQIRHGRLIRSEMFPLEDLAGALTRCAELEDFGSTAGRPRAPS